MKRHLSTLALSALAVAAVGGLTVLRPALWPKPPGGMTTPP